MPVMTMQDTHIDRVLTQFSLGQFNLDRTFVWNRLFPVVRVEHTSDYFKFWPANYLLNTNVDIRRNEFGVANMIGATSEERTYHIKMAALRTSISEEAEANADEPQRLYMNGVNLLQGVLGTKNEKDFVEEFLTPKAQWTFKLTGVDSNPEPMKSLLKWSDAASDPVKDMQILVDNMMTYTYGKRFNKMVLSNDVFIALLNHPTIRDRISTAGTPDNPTMANLRTLAVLFNVDEVLVVSNIFNSETENVSWINGGPSSANNHHMLRRTVLLAYAPSSLGSYTAGIRFVWNKAPWGVNADGGPVIRRYRESPAHRVTFIEAEQAFANQLVAPDLGVLITDIIAKDPNSVE